MEQQVRLGLKKFRWVPCRSNAIHYVLALAALVLVSACGGGSSSSGDSSSTEQSNVIANAGLDQFVQPGDSVTLDGSESENNSGADLTYSWTLTSVPENSNAVLVNATEANAAFVADVEGTYIAELILNDGSSALQRDTVSIFSDNFPIVETEIVSRSPGVIPEGLVASCWTNPDNARGSECPVLVYDDVHYWAYSFKDDRFSLAIVGFNADGRVVYNREVPTVRHIRGIDVNEAEQTVTFRGESESGDGAVTLTWQDLTSNLMVPMPEADAGPNQIYTPGDTVMLDGTGSYGDSPLTYSWTFESIPAESLAVLSDPADPQPTFVADVPGTYVVQLLVNDGTTDSPLDTVIITSSNIPLVEQAMAANPPGEIPEGLKISCHFSLGRIGNPICPTLRYNDLTYWALSYIDNRFSLAIVGFDAAGNVVSQQELMGTRSVWDITVDVDAMTVSFFGDDFVQESVTIGWSELGN